MICLQVGAACGINGLAGDPAAIIGSQERDDAGDVIRPSYPAQGRAGRNALDGVLIATQPGRVDVGIHHARSDGIDSDAPRSEVLGESEGKRVDGTLGQGDTNAMAAFVGATLQGMSQQARDGATQEDLRRIAHYAIAAIGA